MDAHANAAYSLVATAPSPASSGTSLVVTAGEGARFPAVPFNATVWATGAQPTFAAGGTTGGNFEIVRVTGRSTDTLTFTRAQESTTARSIVVGDQIAATVTAKTVTDIEALLSRRALGLAAQGMLNENMWPGAVGNLSALATQVVYGVSLGLKAGDPVTGIRMQGGVAAAGAGLPTTVRAGIADSTGKILALSNNLNAAANFPTGAVLLPLASQYIVLADGAYFACVVADGVWTTQPTLYRGTGAATGTAGISGKVPPGFSWAGQTDLPAVNSSLTITTGMTLSFYMGFYT